MYIVTYVCGNHATTTWNIKNRKKNYLENMKQQTTLFRTICALSLLQTPQFLIWSTEFDHFPCLQHRADSIQGSELSCEGCETVQVRLCLKKSLQNKISTTFVEGYTLTLSILFQNNISHNATKHWEKNKHYSILQVVLLI